LSTPLVELRYRRPPDRLQVYQQPLVHDAPDVKVTLTAAVKLIRPMVVGGRVVSEHGASIVWFSFPGLWHDIGRFHLADGTFTGLYANTLTPVEMSAGHVWESTDLFLDLWTDERGAFVLDEDELEEALARGWIDAATAARARGEVERILTERDHGRWPPAIVGEWPLERARQSVER
jgi:predicted RNA-binding protein associated with RNAse of E/G family